MTAHGAYTKAAHAANEIKELGATTYRNIKALYAAYPLPDDPLLIEGLRRVTDALASIAPALTKAKADSFKVASEYLNANIPRIGKQVTADSAAQTIRVTKRKG